VSLPRDPFTRDAVHSADPKPFGYRVTAAEPEDDPTVPGLWLPASGHDHLKRAIIINTGLTPENMDLPTLDPGDVIWFIANAAPGKLQRRTEQGWRTLWVVDVQDIVAKED
jgi:hypothetical protein